MSYPFNTNKLTRFDNGRKKTLSKKAKKKEQMNLKNKDLTNENISVNYKNQFSTPRERRKYEKLKSKSKQSNIDYKYM